MNIWPALTPVLSFRRGSAVGVPRGLRSAVALDAALDGEQDVLITCDKVALPLLGERTGVRASELSLAPNRNSALRRSRAFTLIEMLLVMALLTVVLAISFPSLRGFFRGRHLDHEARRFLSLTRYAQSRAVSEGYPMVLWVDAKQGTYGMQAQTGYLDEDDKSVEYGLHETLKVEVTRSLVARTVSSQRTERNSVAGNLPAIKFNPDGFYADTSPEEIVLIQEGEGGEKEEVVIAKSENRLGYEIITSNQQLARR